MASAPRPALVEPESELGALLSAVRALSQHSDFKSAVGGIFEALRGALGAGAGYVALLGADGHTHDIVHQYPETMSYRVDPGLRMSVLGLREQVYREQRTLRCNDFQHTEWTQLLPTGHIPIENVLAIPLTVDGKGAGLIAVANKPGGFTEADEHLAAAFGHIASVALSNSRIIEALGRSEERFRATAQSAADAIIIIDRGGHVVSWNATAERLFGYRASEITGRAVTELMPECFREPHRRAFNQACSGAAYSGRILEVAGITKEGLEFPLELSLARWETHEGIFFTGIVRDISARRRAEFERTFLIDASKALAASLDSQATLEKVVSVAVPTLADCCLLEVPADDTHTARAACAHKDRALEGRISEYCATRPLLMDRDLAFAGVLRSREPLLLDRVADDQMDRISPDSGHRQLLHAIGIASLIAVPLYAGDRTVGVLAWFRCANREPFDARDVVLAQEVGRRAVTALEHARLHESTEHERARLLASIQESRRLRRHISVLRAQIHGTLANGETVGQSRAFREVLQHARMVAQGDTTVLLLGETGTGKELLAHMIHQWSKRARAVLIPVNCASIPEMLVESELFGYERGAFTGATERRSGKFEAANGGSLFLDEIGDLPLNAQAKLLRVFQDGQVQRVGSNTITKVDVRVIAATNQDLDSAVREKRFRADLYYRLGVFPIHLPPLRERVEDIRPLFAHFVAHFARRLHRSVSGVDESVFERLEQYAWPGNVRELQNVAERAVILTRDTTIEPQSIVLPAQACVSRLPAATFADAERRAIMEALTLCDGRVSGRRGAAERLGLKPTTLHAKMRKLGISRVSRPS